MAQVITLTDGDDGLYRMPTHTDVVVIYALGGDDEINAYTWKNSLLVEGGTGNELIRTGSGQDTIYGGEGNDSITAGAAREGFDGNNSISGEAGNDELSGGLGADTLDGGIGDDSISGEKGFDWLIGGLGNDSLNGSEDLDTDILSGGFGDDSYEVWSSADLIYEGVGEGLDVVKAYSDYRLQAGSWVERLSARIMTADELSRGFKDAPISLTGNERVQELIGNSSTNTLSGLGGNDVISGQAGNDRLFGGGQNDVLSGGAGQDVFVFDTKPNRKTNKDKITDFNVKDDSFWLDNAIFRKLGKGSHIQPKLLSKDGFFIGSKAQDAEDRIIYNKKTGTLFYDPDGSGSKAPVPFATLAKNLKLTHKDFFIV